jgi:hypothetical protein
VPRQRAVYLDEIVAADALDELNGVTITSVLPNNFVIPGRNSRRSLRMNANLVETTNKRFHLQSIATLVLLAETCQRLIRPVAENPPISMENVMRGRVMMILASAVLAGSLLATGAQARGGGGGGGHGGGGMGGFGGGHMGGFGGGHMAGFGAGRIGGLGGDHIGGIGAGQLAHVGHERFGAGRRRFVGGGFYGDGLDCPYYDYRSSMWPYNCAY